MGSKLIAMRLYLITLLAFPIVAFAQTSPWRPSREKASELAKTADLQVRSLRNITMSSRITYSKASTKESGYSNCDAELGPKGEFRVEYPLLPAPNRIGISKLTTTSDGKKFVVSGLAVKNPKIQPLSARKTVTAKIASSFFYDYPSLVWATLGTKELGLTEALKQLAKVGYKITVEARDVVKDGIKMPQHRIRVQTTAQQEKKGLGHDWDLIIDDTRHLPVKINYRSFSGKVDIEREIYDIRWNLMPGQKIPPSTFVVK